VKGMMLVAAPYLRARVDVNALLFALCGAAVLLYSMMWAKRRRASLFGRRFSDRPSLSFDEWYSLNYPSGEVERWVAQEIIDLLGGNLGVAPTKL
jgi:hypothetical protein